MIETGITKVMAVRVTSEEVELLTQQGYETPNEDEDYGCAV